MNPSAAEEPDPERLATSIRESAVLSKVLESAKDETVFLVGGTVRDMLVGQPATDFDLVMEGPIEDLALTLDPDGTLHDRFETAEITVEGHTVDIARARTEVYPRPGALPEVSPATIDEDLWRRDFTINAMAVALNHPDQLIDPYAGLEDLRSRCLRPLRAGSFEEDPTRLLRAARYATRFDLELVPDAAAEAGEVDLGSTSTDRLMSEMRRLVTEAEGKAALLKLGEWGVGRRAPLDAPDEGPQVLELLETAPWEGFEDAAGFGMRWLLDALEGEVSLPITFEGRPSEAVELLAGLPADPILLARVRGAAWLDTWLTDWRDARPVITGQDLIDRGVPEGRAVGAGLKAALAARLDEGVRNFDSQLAVALAAAGPEDADGVE